MILLDSCKIDMGSKIIKELPRKYIKFSYDHDKNVQDLARSCKYLELPV